jgi:hypothetical protein
MWRKGQRSQSRVVPGWVVLGVVAGVAAGVLVGLLAARSVTVPSAPGPTASATSDASVTKNPSRGYDQVGRSPPSNRQRIVQARPVRRPIDHWRSILTRLSRLRARAWRRGQPRLLQRLYVAEATALRSDRLMLRRYVRRGLTVRGVQLAFGQLRVASRAHRVVHLRVVDQLQAAVAIGRDGGRVHLPSDRPTRHLITLARTPRGWRIQSVTIL